MMLSKTTYISNANIDSANNKDVSSTSFHKDGPQVGNVVVVKYATN